MTPNPVTEIHLWPENLYVEINKGIGKDESGRDSSSTRAVKSDFKIASNTFNCFYRTEWNRVERKNKRATGQASK